LRNYYLQWFFVLYLFCMLSVGNMWELYECVYVCLFNRRTKENMVNAILAFFIVLSMRSYGRNMQIWPVQAPTIFSIIWQIMHYAIVEKSSCHLSAESWKIRSHLNLERKKCIPSWGLVISQEIWHFFLFCNLQNWSKTTDSKVFATICHISWSSLIMKYHCPVCLFILLFLFL